jgi:predicted NBD/HSP70 family sugar kinase
MQNGGIPKMHKTYIGMDIHKNFIQAAAIDEKGNIIQEKRFSSDLQEINNFIQKLNSQDIQAAIESTCT